MSRVDKIIKSLKKIVTQLEVEYNVLTKAIVGIDKQIDDIRNYRVDLVNEKYRAETIKNNIQKLIGE